MHICRESQLGVGRLNVHEVHRRPGSKTQGGQVLCARSAAGDRSGQGHCAHITVFYPLLGGSMVGAFDRYRMEEILAPWNWDPP